MRPTRGAAPTGAAISSVWQERWIQTNWANTQIKDFTGNSTWIPTTQGDKWVKIQCPPNSYTVWSLNI